MRTSPRASLSLAAFATSLLGATCATAAELPPIKVTSSNEVAACATPGRLMAFTKSSNPKLAEKFGVIATEYMRHGEELGLRWDYAYFQMLLETGFLKYTGDVKPDQNNFAGLGATGRGARGESFKDVSTGVRAHLQHLLMYSGEQVADPVAERTRNIQEWGVLTKWQKSIEGPMTFTHLAKQWAPGSRGYSSDIAAIAGRFMDGPCLSDDPAPELVAEARKGRETAVASANPEASKTETKGEVLARKALETARTEGALRSGLGGSNLAAAASAPNLDILNAAANPSAPASETPAAGNEAKVETAALATTTKDSDTTGKAEAKSDGKSDTAKSDTAKSDKSGTCRVWTASYGGTKAVIIKAAASGTVNYTVLDVNDGAEQRESDAYIAAYAKGGEKVAEYPSQNAALNKAFELCPEG